MRNRLRQRRNLAECRSENWRPPPIQPRAGRWPKLGAAVRRFFDLQAGSIWDDLAGELVSEHGRVLDVGCGAQPYRVLLPPDAAYTGVDTKAHFGYEMPDTVYFAGEAWPVPDEAFDVVLGSFAHPSAQTNLTIIVQSCPRRGLTP